jgi:hypothetical protein
MTFDHITISSKIKDDDASYTILEAMLTNSTGTHELHDQHRALYSLKNLGTERALEIMMKGSDFVEEKLEFEFIC